MRNRQTSDSDAGSLAMIPSAIVGIIVGLYIGQVVWVELAMYGIVIQAVGAIAAALIGFRVAMFVTMLAILALVIAAGVALIAIGVIANAMQRD